MKPKPQSPCKRFKGKKLGKHEYWSPNLVNKIQRSSTMRIFEAYNLQGWKLIYVTLIDGWETLMDVDFFNDLQSYLQTQAENNNVNPLDHEEWIKWLNNEYE